MMRHIAIVSQAAETLNNRTHSSTWENVALSFYTILSTLDIFSKIVLQSVHICLFIDASSTLIPI